MTKSGMNLQDSFLNQVRKENTEIMLVLLDGTRLAGYVRGFDNFTVIMNVRGAQHLIYKHAIAQIVSRRMTHPEGEGRENREDGQSPSQGAGEDPGHPGAPEEGNLHGTPDEAAPAGAPANGPEGFRRDGAPEGQRRDGGPRRDRFRDRNRGERDNRDRGENNESPKPKFNTIDFSSLKFEEPKEQV